MSRLSAWPWRRIAFVAYVLSLTLVWWDAWILEVLWVASIGVCVYAFGRSDQTESLGIRKVERLKGAEHE